MTVLREWALIFLVCGAGGGLLFLIALLVDAVMTRLDRLPRLREPQRWPRTRRQLYRPPAAAREERER